MYNESMKKQLALFFIGLMSLSACGGNSKPSSSAVKTFEDVPLNFEIKLVDRGDYNDCPYLNTDVSYLCFIECAPDNTLKGAPIFTYDQSLIDIFYPESYVNYSTLPFYIAVKDSTFPGFDISIEWRTQKITKTYAIVRNNIRVICLHDEETAYGSPLPDYGDLTIIDTQAQYENFRQTFNNHFGSYELQQDMSFEDSFLLVSYFSVSQYRNYYSYNRCFTFDNNFFVDMKHEFHDQDDTFNVVGQHYTLLRVPNEYKSYTFRGHISPILTGDD